MKTKEDLYWDKKVAANPWLTQPKKKAFLSAASFEKEIRKAFEAGRKVGFREGYDVGKLAKLSKEENNTLDDLFQNFGDK